MYRSYIQNSDLKKREPELSRLRTDPQLDAVRETASNDFLNDLRSQFGSIPSNIMQPNYFFEETEITGSNDYSKTFTDPKKRLNRFVIDKTVTTATGSTLTLKGSRDGVTYTVIKTIAIDTTASQTFKFPTAFDYYLLEIKAGTAINMTATAFLVESPFDECEELLSISYAFGQCIKTGGDIFIDLSDKFRKDYERKLSKLNFGYDRDGNGINDSCIDGITNYDILDRW